MEDVGVPIGPRGAADVEERWLEDVAVNAPEAAFTVPPTAETERATAGDRNAAAPKLTAGVVRNGVAIPAEFMTEAAYVEQLFAVSEYVPKPAAPAASVACTDRLTVANAACA